MEQRIKKCTICNCEKPNDQFVIYQNKCKNCIKVIRRQYYLSNDKINHTKSVGRPRKTIKIMVPDIPP